MRKPRDFDSELKALNERASQLKSRKLQQLGELVIATGADALAIELLAGALIAATHEKDTAVKEGWRNAGASFFQRARQPSDRTGPGRASASPDSSPTLSLDDGEGAQ